MKSRRVLQVIVAVLSLVVLVCLLLSATLVVVANKIDVIPQLVRDWTTSFKSGLNRVADYFAAPSVVVPAVAFGAPALLLLLAIIMILAKNNGKDAKNNVGCVFSLIGVAIMSLFVIVFADKLFEASFLYPVYGASGGLLALFVLFVGLALGVNRKKKAVAEAPAETTVEAPAAVEPIIAAEEVKPSVVVEETTEEGEDVEELNSELVIEEKVREATEEETESADVETPATEYVPNEEISIRNVVEETYGKNGDSLSATTLQKINKVRALYEAKVLSEDEYIKLINKYLGF